MSPVGPLFTLGRKIQVEFTHATNCYSAANNKHMLTTISQQSQLFNKWTVDVNLFNEGPKGWDNYLCREASAVDVRLFQDALGLMHEELERLNGMDAEDLRSSDERLDRLIAARMEELVKSVKRQNGDLVTYTRVVREGIVPGMEGW